MQIKNVTNRKLEIQVASKSSQTLWQTTVDSETTVSKELSSADAPFTVVGRWLSDPPLQYNFVPPTGVGNVKRNDETVTITDAFPSFFGQAS
ncbi:hypothetical protein [Tahibacter amnicola]|uniref:MSP domain-containing protein n=1 Tax=Tahibacter amnicola TaxID=2976241 RepID=A0ABY6BLB3_9GAMM|nr:hypothetical protein [Tahibacter amnicola]UXI70577.1 hypothetical protein N4264_13325 [Tahibacter amnicola]